MSDEIVTADAGAVSPESTPAAEPSAPVVTPEAETPNTGAEPVTPAAEPTSDTVPAEAPAAPTHQKTLEERVAELTDKRVAEVEARLTASLAQPPKLDFIPDLDMGKVNDYIRDSLAGIEQLQLDGKFLEALEAQDALNATRASIKANEQRKMQYTQQQEAQQQSQQQIDAVNTQIEAASKLVAKEHNIPEEVWKKGEEFFLSERRAKPLIDAQYREKVMLQGPVAAMLWAKDYVTENMGKSQKELIDSKEAAKLTLPAGKTAGGVPPDAKAAGLAAARAAAASGNPQDIAAYSKALREASQPG